MRKSLSVAVVVVFLLVSGVVYAGEGIIISSPSTMSGTQISC